MEYLAKLGWDDFFESAITPDDKSNFIIARIVAEHKNAFTARTDTEFRVTMSGRMFHGVQQTSDMPIVGDWVLLRRDTTTKPGNNVGAVIERILPRRTILRRRAPRTRKTFGNDQEQNIVSNIDTVFIVTSLNQNFNLSRIERALALVHTSGAKPIILLSKSDLIDNADELQRSVEQIAGGAPVIPFSNITGQNIDTIAALIKPGETACLIGSSGVGKTSLMNILADRAEKVATIRTRDAHGRHATTSRSLYIMPNGGMLVDTPGLREIGLVDAITESESDQTMYDDIEELISQCKFSNCAHNSEPGCAIRKAIESGDLDERRFENYLKLQKETAFHIDSDAGKRAKQAWAKDISKKIRKMKF